MINNDSIIDNLSDFERSIRSDLRTDIIKLLDYVNDTKKPPVDLVARIKGLIPRATGWNEAYQLQITRSILPLVEKKLEEQKAHEDTGISVLDE